MLETNVDGLTVAHLHHNGKVQRMFKPLLQSAELYLVFSERNTRNRGNGDYGMNRHPPVQLPVRCTLRTHSAVWTRRPEHHDPGHLGLDVFQWDHACASRRIPGKSGILDTSSSANFVSSRAKERYRHPCRLNFSRRRCSQILGTLFSSCLPFVLSWSVASPRSLRPPANVVRNGSEVVT